MSPSHKKNQNHVAIMQRPKNCLWRSWCVQDCIYDTDFCWIGITALVCNRHLQKLPSPLLRSFQTVSPQRAESAFTNCERQQLPKVLLDLAHRVNLKRFLKQPRTPKKKQEPSPKRFVSPPSINCPNSRSGSTATKTRASCAHPTVSKLHTASPTDYLCRIRS